MSGYDFYQPEIANPNDGENITLCKILDKLATSYSGGKVVGATTASGSGSWYALQFVTSGTLSAYTGDLTGVTGVTFPAGFILYGNVTAFTTGSGTTVVAYTA